MVNPPNPPPQPIYIHTHNLLNPHNPPPGPPSRAPAWRWRPWPCAAPRTHPAARQTPSSCCMRGGVALRVCVCVCVECVVFYKKCARDFMRVSARVCACMRVYVHVRVSACAHAAFMLHQPTRQRCACAPPPACPPTCGRHHGAGGACHLRAGGAINGGLGPDQMLVRVGYGNMLQQIGKKN